jgi:glutaredoxin
MVRNAFVLLLVLAAAVGGCRRKVDDGTDPTGGETLPPLELRDETPELLLTWIDGKGDTHTAVRVADVPMEGRNPVRVIARDAGQGQVFYVADLTLKQSDGSYAVRTMPRGEWEGLLESRRLKARPQPAAPPPSPEGPSATPEASPTPETKGAAYAVIYGAEWCGPCHQAKAYLERRGVPVTFHDIEKDPKRAAEMKRKLREANRSDGNIPVIDVGGKLFVGFNPRALDQAIAQAKPTGGTPI